MNRINVLSVPDVSKEQPETSSSQTHPSKSREPINRDAPSYPRGKGIFKHTTVKASRLAYMRLFAWTSTNIIQNRSCG